MVPFLSIATRTVAAVTITNIVLQDLKRKTVLFSIVSIIAISSLRLRTIIVPVINGLPLLSSTIFSIGTSRKNDNTARNLFGSKSYVTTRSTTTSTYVPLMNRFISKRNNTIHLEINNQTNDNCVYIWEEEIPIVTKKKRTLFGLDETEISIDEKDEEEVDDSEVTNNNNNSKKRSWISFRKYDTDNMDGMSTSIQQESSSDEYFLQQQPHPLRTDEWCVSIQWRKSLLSIFLPSSSSSPSCSSSNSILQSILFTNKKWYIQFNENGYAKFVINGTKSSDKNMINSQSTQINTNIDTNDDRNCIALGPWEILPCGKVMWILPIYKQQQQVQQQETKNNDNKIVQKPSSTTTTTDSTLVDSIIELDSLPRLVFVADIHPNLFGQQPKMIRGYILLDNLQNNNNNKNKFSMSSWIRPIVATFYANGIGIDSADLSYQSRK